jgi:amino acid transporter
MSDSDLGLTESVAIALGGMIGGGIYAVLGVVAGITQAATWAAFVLAGVVALGAGYSYNRLNADSESRGGSVTFVQGYVGNSTLAGMVGWTLLVGYIGSMAMYAFAFAEFAIALGLPSSAVGSLGAITSFASLAFIVVFGAMSSLAFRQRDGVSSAALPAIGVVGAAAFFPLMLWNLYNREPNTFYTVLVVTAVVVTVELLYFEREFLEEAVEYIGPDPSRIPGRSDTGD